MNQKLSSELRITRESSPTDREAKIRYLIPWEISSIEGLLEAKHLFESIMEDRPDKAEGWRDMGVAYLAIDMEDMAMLAFYKAVSLRDDFAEAWEFLAMRFVDDGQFALAAAAFEKSAQSDPHSTRVWEGLAQAYAVLKRPTETWAALEKLRQLDPSGAQDLEPVLQKSLAR